MDLYGQEEAVNELNSRNRNVAEYNGAVGDFNNNIMNTYNNAKGAESKTDDLTYAKDVMNNVFSGAGMKGAWDNRKYELNKAKNIAAKRAKVILEGGASEGPRSVIAADGSEYLPTTRSVPAGGFSGALGLKKDINIYVPSKTSDTQNILGETTTDSRGNETSVAGKLFGNMNAGEEEGGEAPVINKPTPAPETVSLVKSGEPTTTSAGLLKDPEAVADGEGHGIVAHALNKISRGGIGLDTAESVGKFGGAITGAGMGGVALYDDITNMSKNDGNPFKQGASWEEDANNVGSIIQGVSDVVGVVPGLEWVAGLGNLIGGASSVIGMFGDHSKNVVADNNVELLKNQLKDKIVAPSTAGELIQTAPSKLQSQIQQGQGSF